jgi:hypothetical protein
MAEQSTQEAIAEIWQLFRATDERLRQQFRETDELLRQQFRETDERLARQSRETDEKLRRLEGLFGNQWGKLLEALVQPSALRLFQERGIGVHRLHQRSKSQRNGETREFDLILENGAEVIVVEVKSTLRVEDVNDFLADLAQFTAFFPIYQSYAIYGAVAGLNIVEDADRYAYRRGLFVVQIAGDDTARILNDERFRPRDFGAAAELPS